MKPFSSILIITSLAAITACGDRGDSVDAAVEQPSTAATPGADLGGGMSMTAADPGGFTQDGFTFHTRPGTRHIVRLEAPGSDSWEPASTGEPVVKSVEQRKETSSEGKTALVIEYEMLQSGNASIEFHRMEDGEIEATRTIYFMVH